MKGRVLTVDSSLSKATLTLKRSLVKDKREAISTYEEVGCRESGHFVANFNKIFGVFDGMHSMQEAALSPIKA